MGRRSFRPEDAFQAFDKFVEDLQKLREGARLLEEVYLHCGGYGGPMPDELRHKINDYFGFDDSE